jgi:hypothetical protein
MSYLRPKENASDCNRLNTGKASPESMMLKST